MNRPEVLESTCDHCNKNNIRCSCGLITCNDACPSCRRRLRIVRERFTCSLDDTGDYLEVNQYPWGSVSLRGNGGLCREGINPSIWLNPEQLRRLARFLDRCADEAEQPCPECGNPSTSHKLDCSER